MLGDFFRTQWRLITMTGIGVLVLLGFFAWHSYSSPRSVFADMLVNNLTTRSVTKNETSSSNTAAVLQRVSLQLHGSDASRWLVTISQNEGSVSTDSIGTPTAGYVRYTSISDPKKADYSRALNVWAKADQTNTTSNLPKLFSQSLLDISSAPLPPLGYVEQPARGQLLDAIHGQDIFAPDYSKVTTATINGRQVYQYPVTVRLAGYVALMQVFAHVYGLKDLDGLNPSDYQSASPVKLTISVDKLSHQMVRASYAATNFSETYTDYGIYRPIIIPTKTITPSELQKRFAATP